MKSWKGSLTVEASLVVPIVLACILMVLNQGIELYCKTVEIVQKGEIWEEWEPAKRFRKLELSEDIIHVFWEDDDGNNL
ncbi:MAG: hypothetical protein HFH41_07475 [Lachnospiraceae bacterium]|nr:hypothetical protein [Lachnospiraceae bacterium]